MVWTKNSYPDAFKNLEKDVKDKAIEIANALMRDNPDMDEGEIIATAIKKAKQSER